MYGVKDDLYVVSMFAQESPGKPGAYPSYRPHQTGRDLAGDRLDAFRSCLDALLEEASDLPVYFPYRIGCGLGGGKWEDYRREIESFAKQYKPGRVFIIKQDDN